MSKDKKQDEFAIAKKTETAIALQGEVIELPADFIDSEDFNYQTEEEAPIFPYVSIRQKDPRDDTEIKWKKGWWKAANTPAPVNDAEPPLIAIILFWSKVRTYFPEGAEAPYCKSIDGISGSLKTQETCGGTCVDKQGRPVCPYAQWGIPNVGDRPQCTEGRNLYAYSYIHGPCIIRLGRSGLKPWRAFDNLMKSKIVTAPNGAKIRIPYHLNILEFHTKAIKRPGLDVYYEPDIRHNSVITDKETLDIMRGFLRAKEQYDRTAQQSDLADEDINGKGAEDTEYELDEAIKANNPKTNPDGSVADDDAFNTLI